MSIKKNILPLISLLSLSTFSFAQDGAIVSMGSANAIVNESANSVFLSVNVQNADDSGTVSVSYSTVDGSATAGKDYTAVNGTLSFAEGETRKTITVPIFNDGMVEPFPNETFSVVLSNATNAKLGPPATTTVQIVDAQLALLEFGATAVTVDEGAGTVSLTVNRSGTLHTAVNVDFDSNNGSAIAGEDYGAVSGRLSFARNQTTASIVVPIINDNLVESPDETFTVNLRNPNGGARLGASTVQITISGNGSPPGPPDNLPGKGVSVNSDGSESSAVFRGGVSSDNGLTYGDTFSVGETIIMPVSIEPETSQVGSTAQIFIVVSDGTNLMQVTPTGLVAYDATIAGLEPFTQIVFDTSNDIDLLGSFGGAFTLTNAEIGSWRLFVGYTTGDGVVTFCDPGMLVNVTE